MQAARKKNICIISKNNYICCIRIQKTAFNTLVNTLSKKNYTSEDVAAMAGVSQSTVSRVFGGGANVSEKKRKKVMEIAEKLNYQPNAQARSLITRKTHIIGIVMRNIRDPFYSAVLEIFYNRFAPLGYHLIFIHSENEEIQEKEITKLLEYNVEAAIITDATLSSTAAQKLERNNINVVLFNRYSKSSRSSAVFCDNYMAAKQIALYLVETGHKYYAFISGPINTSTTIDRLKGFEEVLKEKNIKNFVIEPGNYTNEAHTIDRCCQQRRGGEFILLIPALPEKRTNGRFNRRIVIAIPIHANDNIVPAEFIRLR